MKTNFFEKIDSAAKAYWLGFIIADGSVSKDGYKLAFSLGEAEPLEKFKVEIDSPHKVAYRSVLDKRGKTYNNYSLQICSKAFVTHLRNLGIRNGKTANCNLPNIRKSLYGDLIRGLFDGDGSICFLKTGKRKISLIATDSIIQSIQNFLVEELGFSRTALANVADGISKLYINRLDDQNDFLDLIYKESTEKNRLDRKYKKSLIPYSISRRGTKKLLG